MFRSKQKKSIKHYELRAENNSIQIPLIFNGKSVELNSQLLEKGQYTLQTEDQRIRDRIWVMVL